MSTQSISSITSIWSIKKGARLFESCSNLRFEIQAHRCPKRAKRVAAVSPEELEKKSNSVPPASRRPAFVVPPASRRPVARSATRPSPRRGQKLQQPGVEREARHPRSGAPNCPAPRRGASKSMDSRFIHTLEGAKYDSPGRSVLAQPWVTFALWNQSSEGAALRMPVARWFCL